MSRKSPTPIAANTAMWTTLSDQKSSRPPSREVWNLSRASSPSQPSRKDAHQNASAPACLAACPGRENSQAAPSPMSTTAAVA
ncbi:MAG: hypothetical protein M0D55_06900 [Elusimicrobiota bacterium]|nr:MAG: hypothetical protein M0D55_06900 [Elusimicrobiota bacterium]